MSHRSVVGTIDEQGRFTGRYVHSGGSPDCRGPALAELLARYDGGLDQLLTELERYGAWMTLEDPHPDSEHDHDGWVHSGTVGQPGDVQEWGYFFTTRDPATAELVLLQETDGPGPYGTVVERGRIKVTELHRQTRQSWNDIECGEHLQRCPHVVWYHFPDAPEASQHLSIDKYLGNRPLEARDAVTAVYRGVTYQLTGSGFLGGYRPRGGGRDGWWYATGRNAHGSSVDVPVLTKGGKVPASTTLTYPPLYASATGS